MKTVYFLAIFLSSINVFAGGSTSREEAIKEVCDSASHLCTFVKSLNLDPTGEATRQRNGKRVMPFTFFGKSSDGLSLDVEIRREINRGTISIEVR